MDAARLRESGERGGRKGFMAIDFEAEGLLKGTRGKAREARQELLEELAAAGVSVEELRRAVQEDRLALLPVEGVLEAEGRRYTAVQIAERAAVDENFVRRVRLALGLPDPPPDDAAFTEEDLEARWRRWRRRAAASSRRPRCKAPVPRRRSAGVSPRALASSAR
jgi:Adenylate cyclase regulatory domain